MNNHGHQCLTCGKTITWAFAICSDCEKTYGNRASDWPEWLRFLWADVQRERRQQRRVRMYEIPMSGLAAEMTNDG